MKATIKILCLLRRLLICFNDLSGALAESLENKYTFNIASTHWRDKYDQQARTQNNRFSESTLLLLLSLSHSQNSTKTVFLIFEKSFGRI